MLALYATGCVVDEEDAKGDNTSNIDISEGKDSGTNADSGETLEEKKDRIKQNVMALMGDREREDPEKLFEYFCGDYVISSFGNSDDSSMFNKVYQKNGITVNEYTDGIKKYTAVKGGYVFTVVEQNGSFRLYDMVEYENADSHVPSIFDDFGIDISAFYDKDDASGSEEDIEEPELTAEMLTVSGDLKTCTFSDAYMKEVLRMFGKSFGKTDAELEVFVNISSVSGVYSVDSETITFEILAKGLDMDNGSDVGDVNVTISYRDSEADGITMTMKMQMTISMEVEGSVISAPMTMDQTVSGVKYDGNKVVEASFESKMFTDIQATASGISFKTAVYEINSFDLSIEDSGNPKFSVNCSTEQTTAVGESKTTEKSSQILDCTFGTNASKFSYIMTQDGVQAAKIEATGVTLGASGENVPSEVLNIINQELTKLNAK